MFGSEDGPAHMALAESFLASARTQSTMDAEYGRFLYPGTRAQTALRAEELGVKGLAPRLRWSPRTAYFLGDTNEAYQRAEAAVRAHAAPGSRNGRP